MDASVTTLAATLRALGTGLLDLVFPRECVLCGGRPEAERHLCWECARTVRFQSVGSFCQRCGREMPSPATGPFECSACRRNPPAFDAARSAAHFEGATRSLVHELKYRHGEHLVPDLVDLLEAAVLRHYAAEHIDAVAAVPLHPRKRRSRGYNQAALLATGLARRLGLASFPDALLRVRDTPSQTHLSAHARRANMRGAFAPNPVLAGWFAGRTMLLVDDVMTTGSTLSAAADALRASGAARVLALCVARD